MSAPESPGAEYARLMGSEDAFMRQMVATGRVKAE